MWAFLYFLWELIPKGAKKWGLIFSALYLGSCMVSPTFSQQPTQSLFIAAGVLNNGLAVSGPTAGRLQMAGDPLFFVEQLLTDAESASQASTEKIGRSIPASCIIAFAANETGWGKKTKGFNLFGIKADSSWSGPSFESRTPEEKNGKLEDTTARFRAYASPLDSMLDFVKFISVDDKSGRYKSALDNFRKDPTCLTLARGLKDAGYASDSNWPQKISDRNNEVNALIAQIPTLANATAGVIIAYAQTFVDRHVPYLWGGLSPDGVDCSGLVLLVYQHFGIPVPRTSQQQFAKLHRIPRNQLQPADLVFYDTDGSGTASHVGIYKGSGQMIHASEPHQDTKLDTVVTSIETDYWNRRFLGAARVITQPGPVPPNFAAGEKPFV